MNAVAFFSYTLVKNGITINILECESSSKSTLISLSSISITINILECEFRRCQSISEMA